MNQSTADIVYSHYIRLRAADEYGLCVCVTCGNRKNWLDIECGHYVNRRIHPLRYYEKNTHPQCTHCNRYLEGDPNKYRMYLEKKYGPVVFDELEMIRSNKIRDYKFYCQQIAIEYKRKMKELILSRPEINYPEWILRKYGTLNK